jgi:RNA polymerase sigma-70 factor (ECF subfamily)
MPGRVDLAVGVILAAWATTVPMACLFEDDLLKSTCDGLIAAWGNGDEQALSQLMSYVYPELRRIARQQLAKRRQDQTLESAALVNETYLKLVRAGAIPCENRVHFLALCSQMIRRILVDHARGRGYAKHGGNALRVPLDEVFLGTQARGIEVLALDQALSLLSTIDARKGRVVELRYFGGLSWSQLRHETARPQLENSARFTALRPRPPRS